MITEGGGRRRCADGQRGQQLPLTGQRAPQPQENHAWLVWDFSPERGRQAVLFGRLLAARQAERLGPAHGWLTTGRMESRKAIFAHPLEKVKRAVSAGGECGNVYFLHPRDCPQRRLK
jgi:hypothetical protein